MVSQNCEHLNRNSIYFFDRPFPENCKNPGLVFSTNIYGFWKTVWNFNFLSSISFRKSLLLMFSLYNLL